MWRIISLAQETNEMSLMITTVYPLSVQMSTVYVKKVPEVWDRTIQKIYKWHMPEKHRAGYNAFFQQSRKSIIQRTVAIVKIVSPQQ